MRHQHALPQVPVAVQARKRAASHRNSGSRDVSWAPKISGVRIIAPMGLQAGERLGPYEIISLLGAGGMGEVYRARDTRLDRSVAVKVLAPELAKDPEFTARFTREARAISALSHAHICALARHRPRARHRVSGARTARRGDVGRPSGTRPAATGPSPPVRR